MRTNVDSRAFQEAAWQFRVLINEEYSGPRLLAVIRGSQSFMPRAFWMAYVDNHHDLLPFFEAELDALHRGDAEAARTANRGGPRRWGGSCSPSWSAAASFGLPAPRPMSSD